MDGFQMGPRYISRDDGSGKIEWDTMEQLGKLNKDFAISLAQAARDYTIPAREAK